MKLLKEFVRVNGIIHTGATILREAVRGIIIDETNIFMIHSSKNGDYKFPGGGIIGEETHHETLAREIREECGVAVTQIGTAFGKVIEYDVALEQEFEVFKMTSYYYFCHIEKVFMAQKLELYEFDLGFQPVWVDIRRAIRTNIEIADSISAGNIRWLKREIFVLEKIQERVLHTQGL
jgi:8-oxo-dGTP pyrophosphatase MutT (NUDIX family)